MGSNRSISSKVEQFCQRFDLRVPVLLGPMAGVPAPPLSISVIQAGGLGSCGAVLMTPEQMHDWAETIRAATNGPFQMNLWVPDPEPTRNPEQENRLRLFLSQFGPEPPTEAGDTRPPDFQMQCQALLAMQPPVVSSVMGLFPDHFVKSLKAAGIAWIATVPTVREAVLAEEAGADAIVAQGMEAGGHRGAFDAQQAEKRMVGLCSLVSAVVDAVNVPVIAAGGIADGRGLAAALILGASAVQIGTGFLRSPEAQIPQAWSSALASTAPEDTVVSRVFSGRAGRSLETEYVKAATAPGAPEAAPYPVQRGLTAGMRSQANSLGQLVGMQAWAGQSARLAQARPATEIVNSIWNDARELLNFDR